MNYIYYFGRSDRNVSKVTSFNVQALIVEKVINVDPAGNAIGFRNIYPVYIALEPVDSIYPAYERTDRD